MNQKSFIRCRELIRIGLMEIATPSENASCIVLGDSDDAVNCYQLCLSSFGKCAANNINGEEKYDVAILFSPMNDKTLSHLINDGGVVIDCVPNELRYSTEIDANEHFKRIRIVCLPTIGLEF